MKIFKLLIIVKLVILLNGCFAFVGGAVIGAVIRMELEVSRASHFPTFSKKMTRRMSASFAERARKERENPQLYRKDPRSDIYYEDLFNGYIEYEFKPVMLFHGKDQPPYDVKKDLLICGAMNPNLPIKLTEDNVARVALLDLCMQQLGYRNTYELIDWCRFKQLRANKFCTAGFFYNNDNPILSDELRRNSVYCRAQKSKTFCDRNKKIVQKVYNDNSDNLCVVINSKSISQECK